MKKNITFEEAMGELEAAVAKLESGSLTLDQALSEFERAVGYIKLCNEKLSEAEQKVKILIESSSGEITDGDFESAKNEA